MALVKMQASEYKKTHNYNIKHKTQKRVSHLSRVGIEKVAELRIK